VARKLTFKQLCREPGYAGAKRAEKSYLVELFPHSAKRQRMAAQVLEDLTEHREIFLESLMDGLSKGDVRVMKHVLTGLIVGGLVRRFRDENDARRGVLTLSSKAGRRMIDRGLQLRFMFTLRSRHSSKRGSLRQ
jgi:DNA-binding MarR family transcriptional regulator